jgi:hypothetical protein
LAFGTLKNQEFLIVENYFITAKTLKKPAAPPQSSRWSAATSSKKR